MQYDDLDILAALTGLFKSVKELDKLNTDGQHFLQHSVNVKIVHKS